jgi:hypothetical protein
VFVAYLGLAVLFGVGYILAGLVVRLTRARDDDDSDVTDVVIRALKPAPVDEDAEIDEDAEHLDVLNEALGLVAMVASDDPHFSPEDRIDICRRWVKEKGFKIEVSVVPNGERVH